jgi:nickel superoxide dismutase
MRIRKKTVSLMLFVLAVLVMPRASLAHCQIPCGIYDDHARVMSMLEDVETVKKSVTEMMALVDKTDLQSKQQFVRWVNNKEMHAQKIIATISDYFLTQRVKPSQEDYAERLAKHHAVILLSMKAKQTADLNVVEQLGAAVQALEAYYPEHEHEH